MKLPHAKNARIPKGKRTRYLLSEVHPVGKHKAKLFLEIGFDKANATELERAILKIAQTNNVKQSRKSPYGVSYVIEGVVKTPSGSIATIRTVWTVEVNVNVPSLVTAYPV